MIHRADSRQVPGLGEPSHPHSPPLPPRHTANSSCSFAQMQLSLSLLLLFVSLAGCACPSLAQTTQPLSPPPVLPLSLPGTRQRAQPPGKRLICSGRRRPQVPELPPSRGEHLDWRACVSSAHSHLCQLRATLTHPLPLPRPAGQHQSLSPHLLPKLYLPPPLARPLRPVPMQPSADAPQLE